MSLPATVLCFMRSAIAALDYSAAWLSPVVLGIVMARNTAKPAPTSLSSQYEAPASLCSWFSEYTL